MHGEAVAVYDEASPAYDEVDTTDVIVVGSGVAGLTAALGVTHGSATGPDRTGALPLADSAGAGRDIPSTNGRSASTGLRVTLITKSHLGSGGSSVWAQGGVAAAMRPDDSPALHAADTLAVGAGLGEPDIVALLTTDGPRQVRRLIDEWGAHFDESGQGELALGREAAHSRPRILHAYGDATGAEMVRALAEAVHDTPGIQTFEATFVCDLALDTNGDDRDAHSDRWADGITSTSDPSSTVGVTSTGGPASPGRVIGVLARHPDGRRILHLARAVVIATGGIGRVYAHTTNPPESTGDGLAMAARAGAKLTDVEFVQFHPTALDVGADPMPLVTEALRGEGAILVNARGERFMLAEHPLAELAPRDVVARAIWRQLQGQVQIQSQSNGQSQSPVPVDVKQPRVFLDARIALGEHFPARFPTVFDLCRRHGVDPRVDLIPVSPAAHYHMGGIDVDSSGRSSLAGLWACGEVAATGAHGANRLASNSLLEALVFGARVAEDILERHAEDGSERARAAMTPPASDRLRIGADVTVARKPASSGPQRNRSDAADAGDPIDAVALARQVMWRQVGLVRDAGGLTDALATLAQIAAALPEGSDEAHNLITVGALVTTAALARRESRGAHFRSDCPELDPAEQHHLAVVARDGDVFRATVAFEDVPAPASEAWFVGVPHDG